MRYQYSKTRFAGMTLLEMVIAIAIMTIIIAAVVPLIRLTHSSWDSKQGSIEALQNSRVLTDHICRNIGTAIRITDVSNSTETQGYIEFKDNDDNSMRYQIQDRYVQFGPASNLADLAGPVTQLQFTCYDACDLETPLNISTADVNDIRFVKTTATFSNSSELGQDKTVNISTYIQTCLPLSRLDPGEVIYQEFTEAKANANVQSLTISTPPDVNQSDLLIAAVITDASETISAPSGQGWKLINQGNGQNQVTLGVWWKLANISEPTSHQFTWGSKEKAYGFIMRFTGHDPASPINVSASQDAINDSTPTSPSVTTTVSNAMILRIGGFDDDDIAVDNSGLSGYNTITMDESFTGNGTCSGGAGYKNQSTAGSSGTLDFQLTSGEQGFMITLAIAPDSQGGSGGGIYP